MKALHRVASSETASFGFCMRVNLCTRYSGNINLALQQESGIIHSATLPKHLETLSSYNAAKCFKSSLLAML